MTGELDGKVALVTGASSGIGREIALAYAEAGAAVVAVANVADDTEAIAEACREENDGRAIGVVVDVRDEDAVASAVAAARDSFGGLDVVVNAAGVDLTHTTHEARYVERMTAADWSLVHDVNVKGPFLVSRAAIPELRTRGGGSIVMISSGTVRFRLPAYAAYTSSKFALEGLSKVLALELETDGIRVNCLQPGGLTDTAIVPDWVSAEERRRIHRPSVMRASAVYLAADRSRFVTGRSLVACLWNQEHGIVDCNCAVCTTRDPQLAVEWRGVIGL
jgi:3-oxoacyl-[acyl-carrier protein] reductase